MSDTMEPWKDAYRELTTGEIADRAYQAEKLLSELNAARKDAKADKYRYRAMLDARLEEQGTDGTTVTHDDGKRTTYYYVPKVHFDIINEDQVREWAAADDENYIDPTPTLREKLIFEECRRREEEGLPLPPGIVKRSEKELHKSTR